MGVCLSVYTRRRQFSRQPAHSVGARLRQGAVASPLAVRNYRPDPSVSFPPFGEEADPPAVEATFKDGSNAKVW